MSGYGVDIESATIGSRMLRDAIFRARGYHIPPPPPPPPLPRFKKPKPKKRGRPVGSRGIPKVRRINPRIMKIAECSAKHFRQSICDLLGPSKRAKPVEARQIAMYLARRTTSASYKDIGFHFSNRDHSTVMYAEQEVEKRIAAVDRRTLEALSVIHKRLAR